MYIVKPIVAECKHCLQLIEISDVDLEAVASYERNMGDEIEYEGEANLCCDGCDEELNIRISAWEYPVGAVNYVIVESEDVSVIENPVLSCYDETDI